MVPKSKLISEILKRTGVPDHKREDAQKLFQHYTHKQLARGLVLQDLKKKGETMGTVAIRWGVDRRHVEYLVDKTSPKNS